MDKEPEHNLWNLKHPLDPTRTKETTTRGISELIMPMATHKNHKELKDFEGHPVLTQLEDAIDHIKDASKHQGIGVDKQRLSDLITEIRSRITFLEDAFTTRRFQH